MWVEAVNWAIGLLVGKPLRFIECECGQRAKVLVYDAESGRVFYRCPDGHQGWAYP